LKTTRVHTVSGVLAVVAVLALIGGSAATALGERDAPANFSAPTLMPPSDDLTLIGLVYDASIGEQQPLPWTHLTAFTCRQVFDVYAGPDGRYSLFLPGSSLQGCGPLLLVARTAGYEYLDRQVSVADLRAHPQQDFGLWPAADIVVNTTDDELNADGDCSLREAIEAANTGQPVDACPAGNEGHTIAVPAGTYELTLAGAGEDANATGDLDILADLKLIGAGIKSTVLDAKALDRVLHVHAGATVQITGMMITGGRTPDGADSPSGGGDAEPGGALANFGDLILAQCAVSDNRTGDGGDMTSGSWIGGPPGGDSGNGGGIYNAGAVQLLDSWVVNNSTGSGGTGGDAGDIGRAGAGGGVYSVGKLTLDHVTVEGNFTGIGGYLVSPPGTDGGPGGDGGGIYNAGEAAIVASSVANNRTGDGYPAGTHGLAGDGGRGGGIFNTGEILLRQSTVNENASGGGGDGGTCGAGGNGGGIASTGGSLSLVNSTVSGNGTGAGGSGWVSGGCSGGNGGGIYRVYGGDLDNTTIAANHASGSGGGLFIVQQHVSLRNTILAGNTTSGDGPNCGATALWPSLHLIGHNLIQDLTGCLAIMDPADGPNIIDRDPLLLPLGKYGGPTVTHALDIGSPAIDAGSCTDLRGDPVTVDQRGVARPQGNTCDIGSFESVLTSIYLPLVLK
jgi:CSLREA domain-containing protein